MVNKYNKFIIYNLFFAALYYAAARAGLLFATLNQSASPVWPASGVGLAATAMAGPGVLPGIWLAAFAANLSTGTGLFTSALIALGNIAEALTCYFLFRRLHRKRSLLQNHSLALGVVAAAGFGTMIGASVGVATLYWLRNLNVSLIDEVWLTWWAGDALGILLTTPIIFSLAARGNHFDKPVESYLPALGTALLALSLSVFVFSGEVGAPWLFTVFFGLLAAAWVFDPLGLRILVAMIAGAAIEFAVSGRGPFNNGDLNLNLIHVQFFLATLATTSLALEGFKRAGALRLTSLTLIAGWTISGLLFFSLHHYQDRSEKNRFLSLVSSAERRIEDQSRTHENLLLAAAGLFAASRNVEPREWRAFVNAQQLASRHPDVTSLKVLLKNHLGSGLDSPEDQAAAERSQRERRSVLTGVPTGARVYFPIFNGERFLGWIVSTINVERWMDIALESTTGRLNGKLAPNDESAFEIARPLSLVGTGYRAAWSKGPKFERAHDGSLAWAAFSASLVTLLLAGFVSGLESLNTRANQLAAKQTRALREVREQYELAVAGSHDGIWDWNILTGAVYYSPRWKEILGYRDDELISSIETWQRLIHPDDSERNQKKIQAYFEGKRASYEFEGRFRHKDGEVRWCLVRGEAIRDACGRPVRMAGSLTDITGRKNAEMQLIAAREAAEQATKAKSEFLANMSHEIRTPLSGLLGTAKLMRGTSLNAVQLDYLEVIHQSADALLAMLNDILDFSKIEANRVQLEETDFDLTDLAGDVAKMMGFSAAQKGLDFEISLPRDLRRNLRGDPSRIRQILLNLLSNSVKFTLRGEVRFSIRMLRDSGERALLRFEVTDTGVGMSKEVVATVFAAFSQADSSTTRRFGGTGLGLSICKRLAELMGSDIHVRSEPGQGSQFWFDLDLPWGGPLQNVPVSGEDWEIQSTPGVRILVAEDNQINQRVLIELLKQAGYKPRGANDGEEALAIMQTGEIDLVLMDCQMPRLDGLQATRAWRLAGQPRSESLPIIAFTADATRAAREEALAAGMNDYLTKPIRFEIVVRVIEKWIAGGLPPRFVVDESKMSELSDTARLGSPELLREVIEMYLDQAPALMFQIQVAADKGNYVAMSRAAHTLKSASGTLGLLKIQDLCGRIEKWKPDEGINANDLVAECGQAIREAREVLLSRARAVS